MDCICCDGFKGVDIRRLRVLVYLPNALTNLAFRQAIGRVVRTNGPDDDTRAYVVMPSIKILEDYARKVEDEISPVHKKEFTHKKCPSCHHKCKLSDTKCNNCGHEFPTKINTRLKNCDNCDIKILLMLMYVLIVAINLIKTLP